MALPPVGAVMALLAPEEAAEKIGKEALEKAGQGILKKAAGAAFKKIPVVGITIFGYDWATGAFGHAVNEATWPISELWNDE